MGNLEVEPTGQSEYGPCSCCGHMSRTLSGYVHLGDVTLASYVVHFTPGHVVDLGVNMDLVLGKWGDGTGRSDRYVVSLLYRLAPDPGVMVIDAHERQTSHSELAERGLRVPDEDAKHREYQAFVRDLRKVAELAKGL